MKKKLELFLRTIKYLVFLFTMIAVMSSCKSISIGKTGGHSDFNNFLFDRYERSDHKYFSCDQVDISIKGPIEKNVKAKISIHKGEYIFINVNFLGFELGRAELTNDSIKIIDRISKKYYFNSLDGFSSELNLDIKYDLVESLFLKGISVEKGLGRRKFQSHINDSLDYFIFTDMNSGNFLVKSYFDKYEFTESKIEIRSYEDNSFYLNAFLKEYSKSNDYPETILINLKKGNYTGDVQISMGKVLYDKFQRKLFIVNSKYSKIEF